MNSQDSTAVEPDGSSLKGKRGLTRLVNALRYSMAGLRAAWTHEEAFRQEATALAVLTPIALLLPVSFVEKILLLGALLLVLIVELLNASIETAVDRDSLRIDPLAKRAKDMGSAAVLLAVLLAGGIWLAVSIQLLIRLFL